MCNYAVKLSCADCHCATCVYCNSGHTRVTLTMLRFMHAHDQNGRSYWYDLVNLAFIAISCLSDANQLPRFGI